MKRKIDVEKLLERMDFFSEQFEPSEGAKRKRSAVWLTKDGREIPFRLLTNSHLIQLAKALRKQPRMRKANLIRKELVRRGMQAHLQPSYPEL